MNGDQKFSLFAAFVLTLSVVLTACGGGDGSGEGEGNGESGGASGEKVVNILNWSEYIPDDVIKQFEEETGIKVNYSTVSSNEEMVAKLNVSGSGFD